MTRRSGFLAALAIAAAISLTGCSPAPEDGWRELISQAAAQASSGDYAAADTTLAGVESDVTAARDGARIDAARADQILAAVAVVRGDLSTLGAPTPSPLPSPAPSQSAPSSGSTAPTTSPAPDDVESTGTGNNGNGKPGPKENDGRGPANEKDDG